MNIIDLTSAYMCCHVDGICRDLGYPAGRRDLRAWLIMKLAHDPAWEIHAEGLERAILYGVPGMPKPVGVLG